MPDFELIPQKISKETWITLGRCSAQHSQITTTPIAPSFRRKLTKDLLAKGVYAETALEGGSVTEFEVKQLIEKKAGLSKSRAGSLQEAKNILTAYDEIAQVRDDISAQSATGETIAITPEIIQYFNHSILNRLPLDANVKPGVYRNGPASKGEYEAPDAAEISELMARLCKYLNSNIFEKVSTDPIINGLIKATIAHLYITWISPFSAGNGHTARLAEFTIMGQAGVATPALNLLNTGYYSSEEQYRQLLKEAFDPQKTDSAYDFLSYAAKVFLGETEKVIETIQEYQLEVTWSAYLHELFKDKSSRPWHRRRQLIWDISNTGKPVSKKKLTEISGIIGAMYANKTDKTLSRDIMALKEMGIIKKVQGGYIARKDVCQGIKD